MIPTIPNIKRLASARAEENWRFRCRLLASPIPREQISSLICRLYKRASERIPCTTCGNCCRRVSPLFDARDIAHMAKAAGLSDARFEDRFLKLDDAHPGIMVLKKLPCAFLKNSRCSRYRSRPFDCRAYPHIRRHGNTRRMTTLFSNIGICPIVFNVWEGLKKEFGARVAGIDEYDWV